MGPFQVGEERRGATEAVVVRAAEGALVTRLEQRFISGADVAEALKPRSKMIRSSANKVISALKNRWQWGGTGVIKDLEELGSGAFPTGRPDNYMKFADMIREDFKRSYWPCGKRNWPLVFTELLHYGMGREDHPQVLSDAERLWQWAAVRGDLRHDFFFPYLNGENSVKVSEELTEMFLDKNLEGVIIRLKKIDGVKVRGS